MTGATAGFGTAICRTLIQHNYNVIGTGRRAERLAALQQEFGADFCHSPLISAIATPQKKRLTTCLKPGKQWILVNNAGLALGLIVLIKLN